MILVTGGTGFMGSRLVKRLVEKGHTVRAMAIENDPQLPKLEGVDCEIVTGDITKPQTLEEPMKGVQTLFHLAAVLVSDNPELFHRINYEGTRNVVDKAVEAGVEHFVYISAAAANYKVRTTYGETKIQAEQLMKRKRGNTNFTMIRPTLIYGPGGGGQELVIYIDQLKKFKWFIPLVGSGKARKRWVWIDDVIEGLTLLVDKPITYGRTYNFGGGSAHSMRKYTEMLCQQLGINKPIVPIPVPICYTIAWFLKIVQKKPILKRDTILGVTMDADFSIEEAKRDIGYDPVSFEAGIRRCFP
jgi:nucleoside-diphosphate-sugar epimerase